jgi:transcription elongation factor Elf1
MALQICPKCKVKDFTWQIDEELSPLTQWICGSCGYIAEENETFIQDCPRCAAKKSSSLLKDSENYHRWCWICGAFEATKESFGN